MANMRTGAPVIGIMQRYTVPVSRQHTVVPGQSIPDIGMIHGVDPGAIMTHPRNRHIVRNGSVPPGTRLFIPG
jgi:hypothetical protein